MIVTTTTKQVLLLKNTSLLFLLRKRKPDIKSWPKLPQLMTSTSSISSIDLTKFWTVVLEKFRDEKALQIYSKTPGAELLFWSWPKVDLYINSLMLTKLIDWYKTVLFVVRLRSWAVFKLNVIIISFFHHFFFGFPLQFQL